MGTMSAPAREEFFVVMAAVGRTITSSAARSKSKVYLLEDKRLVVLWSNDRRVVRDYYDVESASFHGDSASFQLAGGGVIRFERAECDCGMGAVSYSTLTDAGREIIRRVRPPEWVEGL